MKLAELIKPYEPAEGPPPNRLWPFFRWALMGTFPIIILASILAGSVGTLEAFTAIMLGLVIDAVVTSGPERFISDNVGLFLLLFGFFVVLRPVLMGVSAMFNQYVLGPNVLAQVLSRISRWTLGHSVQFFDNDFAGRIADRKSVV